MQKIVRSYCGLCHPRCGTLLHIEDGKVVKVTGDPDHIYHPQRLNYPLKRTGERGQGQWQRITWDQALDEVAEKLTGLRDKYGAETLTFTHGIKRTYHRVTLRLSIC